MSTRSTISALCRDGRWRSIYCHYDGYFEHVGQTLLDHYATQERIEALLELGHLSSLDASIEKPAGHSYENPVRGHTVAYMRDWGETGQEAVVGVAYAEIMERRAQGYDYVWLDGQWWFAVQEEGTWRLEPLAELVSIEDRDLTFDAALAEFRANPCEQTRVALRVKAREYHEDGMIGDHTFQAAMAEAGPAKLADTASRAAAAARAEAEAKWHGGEQPAA